MLNITEESYSRGEIPPTLTETFLMVQDSSSYHDESAQKAYQAQYAEACKGLRVSRIGREDHFQTMIFYDPDSERIGWSSVEECLEKGLDYSNLDWSETKGIPEEYAENLKDLGLLDSD